ncbi:tetratricopeptide repeat protein [Bradyrhizobium sp. CCGUVB14]|uniref:tetratricopeptide repeat protein n=1 Tax=Bradyrhizobium sp. CCGUVB14 TaxID=2949628 RepID=UPI0020B3C2EA|nr:tetratricopeptide repeat protein [Bradyrhizobium sp. CCGUVB14]MCP3447421.1 sel1 repeat family protein [Bradyrhizobium sp. CCGUVB14]
MSLAKQAIVTVICVLIFFGRSSAEPLGDARSAYEAKDYAKALSLWLPLAQEGNAEAQRFVGILYDNGYAVPQDGRQAVEWFRKAAAQSDAQAEYRLGTKFVSGHNGLPQDIAQGLSLMEKAGEHGYAYSYYWIGNYYERGAPGLPADQAQAVKWWRKAADMGDSLAQTSLGFAYQQGRGVNQNVIEAISWYRKAAGLGELVPQVWLGRIYERGESVGADKVMALCWYRKAAQHNDPYYARELQQGISRLEREGIDSVNSCQ